MLLFALESAIIAGDDGANRIGYVRFRDAFCRYRSVIDHIDTMHGCKESIRLSREDKKEMTTVACHYEKEHKNDVTNWSAQKKKEADGLAETV